MAKLKFAFMGFRHGHIMTLYNQVGKRTDAEIVAACEEHESTRRQLKAEGNIAITHDHLHAMLDQAPCDVVAVGDYYGRRGAILIEALRRGKHVICDKPICTALPEWTIIRDLARDRGLAVGCMLDMRGEGVFLTMRELIRSGEIGRIHAVSFNGQHPLMYGTRPAWYFEEGKHGGTINDIAIHAMDCIPWITGLRFQTINAARNWNARLPQVPHFKDAAQMMLTLENGAGVLGDVSYLAPERIGYALPQYWRMTFWGEGGVLENMNQKSEVMLYQNGAKEERAVPSHPEIPDSYLEAFIGEIRGETQSGSLSSSEVLESSRIALLTQDAADNNLTNVSVT
ncbi:MAG: Gfo/Idh/MocA family oxidoreductase [Verrucomicrobia bacterium]|nr:Gfo/Idh/MocA family oxidoreductase [Verrucomicrobiota bacterium]MCG2679975.1 Gfo/Idh/MocA family oxidoreductase [Kiritimatiellia bacterium]MBU4247082.1 Gfo/Idh/MocA family oxidoreductase [Verrucomicrobiota bacterium]MBU4290258.1 Gfo/Idh/MocA family oxidoreductase [Verrucomicrobiota bacterium]MBU4428581.1 Gfo/Idh/MocA family oxidoreductase [Verrucomicrobiota bacterium]